MLKTGFWVAALAAASTAALAQSPDLDALGDVDLPVALTATRLKQSQADVPASVTIIDHQMIALSGARDLHEILRLVPGMVSLDDDWGEPVVAYHGTNIEQFRRMQVLIDGRSVYQPGLARVNWVHMPLAMEDIERIEVIRGPNSAAYGANAFLAIINIITRDPRDDAGSKVKGATGEDEVRDAYVRHGWKIGATDLRLSAFQRRDEGFDRGELGTRKYDGRQVRGAVLSTVSTPSADTELVFQVGHSEGRQEIDIHNAFIRNLVQEQPLADHMQHYAKLGGNVDLSEKHRLRASVNISRFERDEVYRGAPALAFVLPDDPAAAQQTMTTYGLNATTPVAMRTDKSVRETRLDAEIEDTLAWNDRWRTVFGAGWREDSAESATFLPDQISNQSWRIFAHGEYRLHPQVLLNAGLTWEHDSFAGDFHSPRIAVNWQPNETHTVKAIVSRAIHTPDIFEQRGQYIFHLTTQDPQLSGLNGQFPVRAVSPGNAPAERILARELSWHGQWPEQHLSADVKLFHDDLELADHKFDLGIFSITPTANYLSRGAEGSLQWRPLEGHRLLVNYAYLSLTSNTAAADAGNFKLNPDHIGSLAWWMDMNAGWQSGLTYYFIDRAPDNYFYDEVAWRFGKEIQLCCSKLTVATTVQYRLDDEPETQKWNLASDQHRAWISLEWQY